LVKYKNKKRYFAVRIVRERTGVTYF